MSHAASTFCTDLSTIFDDVNRICRSFRLVSFEIRGSVASFTRKLQSRPLSLVCLRYPNTHTPITLYRCRRRMAVAHREPSSVSPSAAEKWSSPLRRTKDVSPTPSSEHEPSRMGMGTQTTPPSTAEPDALGESTPPPAAMADSEDVAMSTSSSFVEPPPTTSTSIVFNMSSTLNVPTERSPLLQLQVRRCHDCHHMQSKL